MKHVRTHWTNRFFSETASAWTAGPAAILILALAAVILQAGAVSAAEPSTRPLLRRETGMHTAVIRQIGMDRDARFLATASDDKTVKIWNLATGRLLRTLRPPIAEGHEGKIYAVAMSPDGTLVTAGGWTQLGSDGGHAIYVFDCNSGRMVRRITGLANTPKIIVFSRDGRFLATGLGDTNGVRVFRTSDFRRIGKDSDYGGGCYGVAFDSRNRLATTCEDGYVRLYDTDYRRIAKKKAPGGEPYSVAFSPDGTKLAVSIYDFPRINVLSGRDLSLLFSPDTSGVDKGNLSSVCWSFDGSRLLAAGQYSKNRQRPVLCWEKSGRGSRSVLPGPRNTVTDLVPMPSGDIAWGAADPAWGVMDETGAKILGRNSAIADYRDSRDRFRLSEDGTRVEFGFESGGKRMSGFDLMARKIREGVFTGNGMTGPKTSAAGTTVTDWKNNYRPKVNGNIMKLKEYERSRSAAVSADGSRVLLGASWNLRAFDKHGKQLWKMASPGSVWSVNIAPNGAVAVAACADGTIRWYRMSDGEELLALFPHKDGKRWVAWTPTGYYDASPGGDDLIGWHVNRGKDKAADFFPASRFRSAMYRPDVTGRVLETLDEQTALRLADAAKNKKTQTVDLAKRLPPVVTIISPFNGQTVSGDELVISYTLRTPSGEPVTDVRAFVNGRPVRARRGISVTAKQGKAMTLAIPAPEMDAEVSLIAENRFTASEPAVVFVKRAGQKKAVAGAFAIRPKLYVLAVGVSDYTDNGLDLAYAAADARDFSQAMAKQKGRLYRDVTIRLLTNARVTRDDILDGLDWIEKQTTQHDVAMIFLAGHGVNNDHGDYYFLPHDTDLGRLRRTGLPFSEIRRTVSGLAGKALFFVDTCHAGNVLGARRGGSDINAVVNELASAENGAVVFASSTGRQYSVEDPAWKNGAFTEALVEGLSGKADFTRKGRVTVNMLDLYISERVKELTQGRQTPTTTKPKTVPDFPVALSD